MRRLGYERYGAVTGNDAGSLISPEVGRLDPEHVVGVHVTQIFSFLSGDPPSSGHEAEEEQRELGTLQWFVENKMSFNTLMAQQPQTLGYATNDLLVSLLARNGQPLGEDLDPRLRSSPTYAARADRHRDVGGPAVLRERPPDERPDGCSDAWLMALAGFGGDFSGIRRFAERDYANHRPLDDVRARRHFAAHKASDDHVGDIRAFFAGQR